MKILVYETNEDDLLYLINTLRTINEDLNIDTATNDKVAFLLYEQYDYDAIFFNIENKESRSILTCICQDKKVPRVIALASNLNCTKLDACDFCKTSEGYNLLVKPYYMNELIYLLFGYSTREAYCDAPKLQQLKLIDQEIKHFNLCLEQNIFINNNSFLEREEELLLLIEKLSAYDIKYEIDNTKNIRIL